MRSFSGERISQYVVALYPLFRNDRFDSPREQLLFSVEPSLD
jgi:hypothetical protein